MSSKLFFVHIPKSAGTSFKNILEQNFSRNEIFSFYSYQQHANRIDYLNSLPGKDKIKCLLGHLGYGIHEKIDPDVDYITILRDPIERVVSMYYHIRRDVNHQMYEEVSKMSLKDYIESGIDESATNSQTRFLSGSKFFYELKQEDDKIGFAPFESEEKMLEAAKSNLANFSFVGITEKFDESLVLLKEQTYIDNVYYLRLNTAKNRPHKELPKDVVEAISSYNKSDLELYNYAYKIFLERLNNIDDFEEKLFSFKRLNKRYGAFWGYTTRIKFKFFEKFSANLK